MHLDHFLSREGVHGSDASLLGFVSEVVSAYVSNNALDADKISVLIRQVYQTLTDLKEHGFGGASIGLKPVVPIEQSVTDDYIICLEDGKELKMLKRHLRAIYNMSPEQYRARWGLPESYPMVAPNYAKKRSSLAKQNGLGRIAQVRTLSAG